MLRKGLVALAVALGAWTAISGVAQAAGSVVQQYEMGDWLWAHRYVAADSLQVAVQIDRDKTLNTYTVLDFDRDGRPDAIVEIRETGGGAGNRVLVNTFRVLDAAYDPATDCLTRSSANLVLLDQHS